MKGKLVVENKDKLLESRALANVIKSADSGCRELVSFCTGCYVTPCQGCVCNWYKPEEPKTNERYK
jgi:hypothetical protein